MAQTIPPFPLGAMVGGPNGSDPAAMARFAAQYKSFTELMGAPPQFMNAFVDPMKPIWDWPANSSWTAWSWRQSPLIQNTIPVLGMPMSTEADRGNPGSVYRAFAAGQHDNALRGIIESWASHGYKTLYFRPGYEMNGSFMAWYAGSDAQTRSDWVAAFRHISDVVRSVPGTDVKVIWNPNVQSWNEGGNVLDLYPGDKYVDVIGADIYSPVYPRDLYSWSRDDGSYDATFEQWMADPVNRVHYWTYPDANRWHPTGDNQGNSLSLQDVIDFAIARNKPFALPETGSGSGGNGNQGPNDDPAFAQWLAATLAKSGVKVAMVNIWDLDPGDGNWTFSGAEGNKPLAAAAWAKYFGAKDSGTVVTVGEGPDSILLTVSEDAWQGDAQFTVTVDGQQVGGTLTATAAHGAGPTQSFSVLGSFGTGVHTVGVTFLNDAWGGTAATDRNLYVDSLSYGGVTTAGAALERAGTQTFRVGSAGALSVGSGPDSITLRVSEDAWQGDAQFTVSVDGKQVGGTLTANAAHGTAASQTVTVLGIFGAGVHTVGVNFLNDAWGGTAATDRNLYVDSLTYGGVTTTGGALMSNGTQTFRVGSPASLSVGSGPDTIVLTVSEDAWQGDAQFTVSVGGKQVGGTLTATAAHGGPGQVVAVQGSFGAGAHTVGVRFLNDAYGGTAGTDRNLYVDAIAYRSATVPGGALMSSGARSFAIPATATTSINATALMAPSSPAFMAEISAPASPDLSALADAASEVGAGYTAASPTGSFPIYAERVSMAALIPLPDTGAPAIPLALAF